MLLLATLGENILKILSYQHEVPKTCYNKNGYKIFSFENYISGLNCLNPLGKYDDEEKKS